LSERERLGARADAGRAPRLSAFAAARIALVVALLLLAIYAVVGAVSGKPQPTFVVVLEIIVPLLIGGVFVALQRVEGGRARVAQVAAIESERRFRTAVEAARCGVWEWDLENDCVILSEVMGVMLGWGGGGEVGGAEVLARIAPEHRDRVQKGLEEAAAHGAFDVSFRVPPAAPGGRSAWIDARGQAVGEPQDGVFTRLVGVALDVTQSARAQPRATPRTPPAETPSTAYRRLSSFRRARTPADVQPHLRELFGLERACCKPWAVA
jgi:two-component system cell cycle sensor histidine kinase PleC